MPVSYPYHTNIIPISCQRHTNIIPISYRYHTNIIPTVPSIQLITILAVDGAIGWKCMR